MEISKDTQERIHSFVKELAPSSDIEIKQYISEILSDKEFHDSIAIRHSAGSGTKYFSYNILAIDQPACIALYNLSRSIKPTIVVETGVASGISSAYILRALDKNNHGKLFSIDLPWQTVKENWKPYFTDEDMKEQPIEEQSGWIIPDYLRSRWQLILGKSSDTIPPLLEKVGAIDVFFHDSEHTYETMLWEFQAAWPNLRIGGVLIGHNIDVNNAFADFEQGVNGKSALVEGINSALNVTVTTGGIVKF